MVILSCYYIIASYITALDTLSCVCNAEASLNSYLILRFTLDISNRIDRNGYYLSIM